MDEMFNTTPDPKVAEAVFLILMNITKYVQMLNVVAILSQTGFVEAPRLPEMFQHFQQVLDNIGERLNSPNLNNAMYDALFTIQETVPFVVELDSYLEEIGAPIKDEELGQPFSEYLARAVKV